MNDLVLHIDGLRIESELAGPATPPIVTNIDLTVGRGEVVALIGESGSGKTTIAMSALGYVRPGLRVASGSVTVCGRDMFALPPAELRALRGRTVSYVAQSAAASFNPAIRLGDQVIEPPLEHRMMSRTMAQQAALNLYRELQLPEPNLIGSRFPHEVSGGQLQRLMAAMAMCGGPELIVFDEPTTALDVTTQISVLKSFRDLVRRRGTAAIYVSHDLAVVSQIADRVLVLLNGHIQEAGTVNQIVSRPAHAYTKLLMAAGDPETARRKVHAAIEETKHHAPKTPLFSAVGINAGYGPIASDGNSTIRIVKDVSFDIPPASVLGVIGESGSGKSTLARVVTGLMPLTGGTMALKGVALECALASRGKAALQHIQMVPQMADTALNPSHEIGKILGRPIEFFQGLGGKEKQAKIREILDLVKLPAAFASRRPQELSGGQKQRVNLARALAAGPQLVVCDEVTSALDSVIRNSILDLIEELRENLGLSFMFISHDISTIARISDNLLVLYKGNRVESGPTEHVLSRPEHPYTKVLIESVPRMQPGWLDNAVQRIATIEGIS